MELAILCTFRITRINKVVKSETFKIGFKGGIEYEKEIIDGYNICHFDN